MKKQFEFILILLLTCAFINCSAFVGLAHAGEKSTPLLESNLIRTVLQAMGKGDALPDFNIEFPTTITELIEYVTNLEAVQRMKNARQERVNIRAERIERLKNMWPFGG